MTAIGILLRSDIGVLISKGENEASRSMLSPNRLLLSWRIYLLSTEKTGDTTFLGVQTKQARSMSLLLNSYSSRLRQVKC